MSFYSEYWEKFLESLNKKESFPLAAKKSAGDKNWIHWECFGQKGFKLIVSLDQNSDWICVNFGIDKRDQKYKFDTLKKNMGQINKNSGLDLRWDPLGKERSNTQAILTKYGVDIHIERVAQTFQVVVTVGCDDAAIIKGT